MLSLLAGVAVGLISGVQAATDTQSVIFTVNCQPLIQYRADPVVFPGQEPSPHVHAVVGGTAFNYTETNAEAIAGHATTCDKLLDHSNYWQPQLYHQNSNGTFSIVEFQGSAVYYLNRACNYQAGLQTCDETGYAQAPPAGLRMVSGNPFLRTYTDNFNQRAISHECLQQSTSNQYNSLPPEPCLRLRAQTYFPSCWDGVNLDSANHSAHVSFPAIGDYNGGVCPESHPVAIYSVFYEFYYNTEPFPDYQNLVYAMGDPTGYGLHGDFINGWTDQNRLDNAMETCTGPNGINDPNCSLNLGGSEGCGQASAQTPQYPAYPEEIGLNGPLAKLPGDNPVTGSFVKRQPVKRGPVSKEFKA